MERRRKTLKKYKIINPNTFVNQKKKKEEEKMKRKEKRT